MVDTNILYEKDIEKQIATITLNRPDKLNAITKNMIDSLQESYIDAEDDPNIKVVVIKGSGNSFSSGMDLADVGYKQQPGMRTESQRQRILDVNRIFGRRGLYQTILFHKKATVCQIHGYCYGLGLTIANACDICVATEDSVFGHPEWRYFGPSQELGLLIMTTGIKKAKEMALTGRPINAWEALQCGLINRVAPDLSALDEQVKLISESIALVAMDGIVCGKAGFELVFDGTGIGHTASTSYFMGAVQTNVQYQNGEYDFMKELNEHGLAAAKTIRDERWKGLDQQPSGAIIGGDKLIKQQ